MTSPSDEKRICAMFDSFCKKVQVQMHLVKAIQTKWRELI